MSEINVYPNDATTNTAQPQKTRLPLGVKVVGIYFIFCSVAALVLMLFVPAKDYAELRDMTAAKKAGAATRQVMIDVLYLSCGVGLFRRRAWARRLGLLALAVATYYGAYSFGWGFSGGRPSHTVLLMSFIIVGTWNAIWFFVLCRRSSAQALS
jgi:hypothetical protein